MKFLLRGIIQILWNLDLDGYILITTDGRVLHGNDAFSSETDLGAGLHAFTDLADNISIKCWNSSFTAENSCCVRDGNGSVNIGALSFISRTGSYGNLQKKVTRLTAAGSGHAFSFQTDTLAGIDTCRNVDLQCLWGTGASVRAGQGDPFICTKSGLIEGNVDAGLHIGAFLWKILLMESAETAATVETASAKTTVETAAVTAVEHISEDIAENIVHIFTIEVKFLIAAIATALESAESTGTCVGSRISACLKCSVAKLVVHFFLLRVT